MKPPSPGHLEYLRARVASSSRALIVARAQRLGATVIKRRERKWRMAVGELVAAMPAGRAA